MQNTFISDRPTVFRRNVSLFHHLSSLFVTFHGGSLSLVKTHDLGQKSGFGRFPTSTLRTSAAIKSGSIYLAFPAGCQEYDAEIVTFRGRKVTISRPYS